MASADQLIFGRIAAPIVIEVGLDYGHPHLAQDAEKLLNSGVPVGFLLHLSRMTDKDQVETEQLICAASSGIRTAYVQLNPRTGTRRWKQVTEIAVSTS